MLARPQPTRHCGAGHAPVAQDIKCQPPPLLDPFQYIKQGDPFVDKYHMPEPPLSNPRKRQPSDQRPLPGNDTSRPRLKWQKVSHPSGSQPPAAFWDNLSKVWLTKRALRELDRRNAAPSPPYSPYRQSHGRITRSSRLELNRNQQREPSQLIADFLCNCGSRGLKDIKLFARRGGPDLSDLQGYPEPIDPLSPTMSLSQPRLRGRKEKQASTSTSNNQPTTDATKSTGPYDRSFQQNLIDGGVYPHAYKYVDGRVPAKPHNWEEIKQRLARPRPSLSPSRFSEKTHEQFVDADAHAAKEKQVMTSVFPTIEGKIRDAKCVAGGIPFTNLDDLTDGTLAPGNPDLYYGARPEQLDRRVRDELSGHIIPSTQDDLPLAPNFFVAAKGPNGTPAVCERQASYDGAIGARGRQTLQSYGEGESVYDNKAYTITSTYQSGQLRLYTSHPIKPTSPGGRPEYTMNLLKSWPMISDPETFRQGATWFRNGRDWAEEQRDDAIARANERANDSQAGASTAHASDSSLAPSFESEGSLEPHEIDPLTQESRTSPNKDPDADNSSDELALDYGPPAKRSGSLSKESIQSQRKRRIAGESRGAGQSHRFAVISGTLSPPSTDGDDSEQ